MSWCSSSFLVANIGGALTPLGDPPLFVGFLRGVDFFWTAQHLWLQTAIVAALSCWQCFSSLDLWFLPGVRQAQPARERRSRCALRGTINILLIALIIAAHPRCRRCGSPASPSTILRHARSNCRTSHATPRWLSSRSLRCGSRRNEHREANGFTWEPIREVAKLFAGIFVAIIPVLAMLQAGRNGPFALLLAAVTANDGLPHEAAYFWLTGLLSALPRQRADLSGVLRTRRRRCRRS